MLIVAAAAVITVLAGGGSTDKSYADRAKDALAALARANRSLSDRFTALTPSTASASIISATDAAATAARDARRRVGALKAADDPALARGLTHAIEAEQAFLGQAGAAAAAPSSADTRALQGAAGRMTDAFAALAGKIAGLPAVAGDLRAHRLGAGAQGRRPAPPGRRRLHRRRSTRCLPARARAARRSRRSTPTSTTARSPPTPRGRASTRSWPTGRPRSPPPATCP